MDKYRIKELLNVKTDCTIQHDGWPCGTCFFSLSKNLTNKDWQNVLLIRGDYMESDLDNLPKNRLRSYNKIIKAVS